MPADSWACMIVSINCARVTPCCCSPRVQFSMPISQAWLIYACRLVNDMAVMTRSRPCMPKATDIRPCSFAKSGRVYSHRLLEVMLYSGPGSSGPRPLRASARNSSISSSVVVSRSSRFRPLRMPQMPVVGSVIALFRGGIVYDRPVMTDATPLTTDDRVAITDLLARYARCLDSGDLEGYVHNFAADAVLFGAHTGHAQIRDYVGQVIARRAADPHHRMHFVGAP